MLKASHDKNQKGLQTHWWGGKNFPSSVTDEKTRPWSFSFIKTARWDPLAFPGRVLQVGSQWIMSPSDAQGLRGRPRILRRELSAPLPLRPAVQTDIYLLSYNLISPGALNLCLRDSNEKQRVKTPLAGGLAWLSAPAWMSGIVFSSQIPILRLKIKVILEKP